VWINYFSKTKAFSPQRRKGREESLHQKIYVFGFKPRICFVFGFLCVLCAFAVNGFSSYLISFGYPISERSEMV